MARKKKDQPTKTAEPDPTFACGRAKRPEYQKVAPQEYASLDVVPPLPSRERDEAARAYNLRSSTKAAKITWEPAYKILKSIEVTPGEEILDLDELAAAWLALIAKGYEGKFALGVLHVGQVTTVEYIALVRYIHKFYREELEFAKGLIANTYAQTLTSMVYDEEAKNIGPRADILKWLLARKDPAQFGNKVIQEISGPNGGAIETQTNVVVFHLPTNPRIPATITDYKQLPQYAKEDEPTEDNGDQ